MKLTSICLSLLICLSACAGSNQQARAQVESSQAEIREELENLKRAVEASYDRERAMAERLRLAEETEAQMREELRLMHSQLDALGGQFKSPPIPAVAQPAATPEEEERTQRLDALKLYSAAFDNFRKRHYDLAIEQFTRLLDAAPRDELADNAQYWTGLSHYQLGKYRQALAAFTKVFVYEKTEKADDAQLMVARCYRALGETGKAREAFQKLVDEYPESEYVSTARREMQDLGEP